jgi:hypothetical protein
MTFDFAACYPGWVGNKARLRQTKKYSIVSILWIPDWNIHIL